MDYKTDLPPLSRLIFGTMSLGPDFTKTADYIRVARVAMEAGLAVHTSHNYSQGQAINILKLAFREAPSSIPPVIAKIYCYNADQIYLDVEEILERLPVDYITVGQLATNDHRYREIVHDILNEGPMFHALNTLIEQGKVRHWTFEIFQKFSHDAITAVQRELFSSATLYLNALERETDSSTWSALKTRNLPIIAMRAFSGGLVDPSQAYKAGRPGKPKQMPNRRLAMESLFEQSGCADWLAFSLCYLTSLPQVKSLVIGTSSVAHLKSNIELAKTACALPSGIVAAVESLQEEWASARVFNPESPYD